MLVEFGPRLYVADGPTVPFLSIPYPTRMAVARLDDGTLWVWSPVALTPELERAVDALGPVAHIVSPNKIHHLFLAEWAERWPEARLHAPPGLAARKPDIHFHAELQDDPDPAWAADIDQTISEARSRWRRSCSSTARRAPPSFATSCNGTTPAALHGWRKLLMRADGLVGERGSTPREWRASFLRRGPARAARARVLAWQPERLLIAHGACAQADAGAILEDALGWMEPRLSSEG